MRVLALNLAAALLASTSISRAGAEEAREPASPIVITINPEARVSVVMVGSLPQVPCGSPVDFSVKIINHGFVTSLLEAELVGESPAGVNLDFHPEPLKGLPEEHRELQITLHKPGPTDLTIAFRAHNNAPDLGGRDRIHFLISCSSELRSAVPANRGSAARP